MTTITEYAVKCDVCGAIAGRSHKPYSAQEAVKQLGWVREPWGGLAADICPECQQRGRRPAVVRTCKVGRRR